MCTGDACAAKKDNNKSPGRQKVVVRFPNPPDQATVPKLISPISFFCQIWLVFAVNLQMLLTGYGIGFSAPCLSQVLDYLKNLNNFPYKLHFEDLNSVILQLIKEAMLTPDELGWFPGCLVLGQVLGILLGPLLADLVNRLQCTF